MEAIYEDRILRRKNHHCYRKEAYVMKKGNKKRVVSLILCGALLAGFVLSPADASAAGTKKTITGTGKLQAETGGTKTAKINVANPGDPEQLETATIPINAQTKGAEIVYSIDVTYGEMKFDYSYGKTWDPEHHVYTGGTFGWNPENLDGDTNNKITITNNSNFPVKASLTVDNDALKTAFNNETPSPSNAVRGCFSEDNDALVNNIAALNAGTYTASSTASATLEMDASSLTAGDVYYRKGNTDSTPVTKTWYFALCGKPDKEITSSTEVGSVTVTITPENGVTQHTKS